MANDLDGGWDAGRTPEAAPDAAAPADSPMAQASGDATDAGRAGNSAAAERGGKGPDLKPPREKLPEIEKQVSMSLDRFFADDAAWEKVTQEVVSSVALCASLDSARWPAPRRPGGGPQVFRVQVPNPYPGVQYRKSKNFDDRYPRYAKHGSTVTGQVEEDGEWLCISGNVFLPMKVGAITILEQLSPDEAAAIRAETARGGDEREISPGGNHAKCSDESGWWSCTVGDAADSLTATTRGNAALGGAPPAGPGASSPRGGEAGQTTK